MPEFTIPCLGTLHILEFDSLKPENVWVQSIEIEACRVATRDEIAPESPTMFSMRETKKSYYIPLKHIDFGTPIEQPVNASKLSWRDFINEIKLADKICVREGDLPEISKRLYIKELILIELPKDDPRYHRDLNPANQDDTFYDGVYVSRATFRGTYQLIGRTTAEERNSWLPGMTRKPMDLWRVEILKTKHVLNISRRKTWKAYYRGIDEHGVPLIHTWEGDAVLTLRPEHLRDLFPSCCKAELIKRREAIGDWELYRKFFPKELAIRSMLEEEEKR
ncbi:MAG: hypothetical protein AB1485_00510 [Candidatus Thermoplasmatota archaeon]